MPRFLGNSPNDWVSGKYPKCLGIWEIYQKPGYLRNFTNACASGKFPKCLGFWEIPQISSHFRNFQNLKKIPPSNTCCSVSGYLGNFPNIQTFEEFSQIPRNLRNFPETYFNKNVNAVVACKKIHKAALSLKISYSWMFSHI